LGVSEHGSGRNGNGAEALVAADRSLELDPNNHNAWAGKAWHFKQQKQYDQSYDAI